MTKGEYYSYLVDVRALTLTSEELAEVLEYAEEVRPHNSALADALIASAQASHAARTLCDEALS